MVVITHGAWNSIKGNAVPSLLDSDSQSTPRIINEPSQVSLEILFTIFPAYKLTTFHLPLILISHRTYYALPSGSPLPPLRPPPTSAHAPHSLYSDPRNIVPNPQTKRVKISALGVHFDFSVGRAGTDFKIGQSHRRMNYRAVIDLLPDELLLGIFNHIRRSGTKLEFNRLPVWKWHVLVHVCRRWRHIVFTSPFSLDINLLCTYSTPVRKYLACWPSLPVIVNYDCWREITPNVEANIIDALGHHGPISQIKLKVSRSLWNRVANVMHKSFPALTFLSISIMGGKVPMLPNGFLGGNASSLRGIRFHGIHTFALSNLLSHTRGLVKLELSDSDVDSDQTLCILPTTLVACLAMLPSLKDLSLTLTSKNSQFPHPNSRTVLPALSSFSFDGERTYLEDFVARIDTPILDTIDITFEEFPDSRIPQLSHFINRTPAFRTSRFDDAKMYFDDGDTIFLYLSRGQDLADCPISIKISSCNGKSYLVGCIAQVLYQTSAVLSNVARLEIRLERFGEFSDEVGDVDDIDWLGLLCQFAAVKTLHISEEFADRIARAFEEAHTKRRNLLPALDLLYLEGGSVENPFAIIQGYRRPFIIRHEVLNPASSESEESE